MTEHEYPPGAQVPSAGTYEQCNVMGTPTGVRVSMVSGDALPAAPRGFTWRKMEAEASSRPT